MDLAKIQLSAKELELVQDAGILLTKNTIIEKVYHLFGEMAGEVRTMIAGRPVGLPPEILTPSPKISKGENYEGLPWVMLDYPRFFNKLDIFAIRGMFWWGHYFILTLHLKGKYLEQYAPVLEKNLAVLAAEDFHVSIGTDEWKHELSSDNYMALQQCDSLMQQGTKPGHDFCKLSAKISLQQWNQANRLLAGLYETILRAMEI